MKQLRACSVARCVGKDDVENEHARSGRNEVSWVRVVRLSDVCDDTIENDVLVKIDLLCSWHKRRERNWATGWRHSCKTRNKQCYDKLDDKSDLYNDKDIIKGTGAQHFGLESTYLKI